MPYWEGSFPSITGDFKFIDYIIKIDELGLKVPFGYVRRPDKKTKFFKASIASYGNFMSYIRPKHFKSEKRAKLWIENEYQKYVLGRL